MMFESVSGKVVPLFAENVDTDQIIPAEYLRLLSKNGLGKYLFFKWRYDDQGQIQSNFPLNKREFAKSTILVAGKNFGIGSSREFAVWALQDYGFKAVIAPSFGDIFYGNALKSGLLCIQLSEDKVQQIQKAAKDGELIVEINIKNQEIRTNKGETIKLELDPLVRERFLLKQDEISYTLSHEKEISLFEKTRPKFLDIEGPIFLD
ncbi:MAG: 3-isopropylmalate dehydratase small subunit [Nitrososphaeria archaeon]